MSQFECNLSDFEEKPKEIKTPPQRENTTEVKHEVKTPVENLSLTLDKSDIFSSKNTSLILFNTVVYIVLNTDSVKEIVFKILPILMSSATDYSLLGTLMCGILLSILSILFTSYF